MPLTFYEASRTAVPVERARRVALPAKPQSSAATPASTLRRVLRWNRNSWTAIKVRPHGVSDAYCCIIMFVFAIIFGALAVLGAAIGIGHVGHPIGGQSVESYGWGLFINGAALAAFFALRAALARSERKTNRKPRPARAVVPAQAARAIAEERTPAAPQTAVDLGRRRAASLASDPPQASIVLPDDPEAILDVLIERVGMAGVDLMLRNRARFADAAE